MLYGWENDENEDVIGENLYRLITFPFLLVTVKGSLKNDIVYSKESLE